MAEGWSKVIPNNIGLIKQPFALYQQKGKRTKTKRKLNQASYTKRLHCLPLPPNRDEEGMKSRSSFFYLSWIIN